MKMKQQLDGDYGEDDEDDGQQLVRWTEADGMRPSWTAMFGRDHSSVLRPYCAAPLALLLAALVAFFSPMDSDADCSSDAGAGAEWVWVRRPSEAEAVAAAAG
ncbi:hypothetical protein U9M48_018598 [Paspalum notatum var. saurae]|uniref:Uncharacterized protein n=1 Tax=Paspalum notatum var. saurae TaxID=547442 RepID=A0AAQ3TD83_PASNO